MLICDAVINTGMSIPFIAGLATTAFAGAAGYGVMKYKVDKNNKDRIEEEKRLRAEIKDMAREFKERVEKTEDKVDRLLDDFSTMKNSITRIETLLTIFTKKR